MKKFFAFLAVMICAFLCFGCAQVDGDIQETMDYGQVFEDTREMIEFHIRVSPELKLFANAQGTVQRVQCLNEDAEKVCRDLELVGCTYRGAFDWLVGKLAEENYLQGNRVTVTVNVVAEIGEAAPEWQERALGALGSAFAEHKVSDVSFAIVGEVIEELVSQETEAQEQPAEDDRFEKVELDENGNVVLTVEIDADGNTVTTYHQTNEVLIEFVAGGSERMFFDAEDNMVRSVYTDVGGVTVECFYEGGQLTQEIIDGGVVVRSYENGVLRHEVETHETSKDERFYNAQGVLEYSVSSDEKSVVTAHYHPDGWVQHIRYEDPEGFWEDFSQADGVLLSSENSKERTKYTYDSSGNMVEFYGPDNRGIMAHVFWLEDRTAINYTYENDGSITKMVQAPNNGTVISYIENYSGPITAEIGEIVPPNGHE